VEVAPHSEEIPLPSSLWRLLPKQDKIILLMKGCRYQQMLKEAAVPLPVKLAVLKQIAIWLETACRSDICHRRWTDIVLAIFFEPSRFILFRQNKPPSPF
jgi:hypothetical protein